jgi:G3E family GTPase
MTKIDIISGFLGAGRTTLIKKLLDEAFKGQKIVLIENEFGEIGIDGGFLKDAGVEITEMNSGCICCSLVGDFGTALKEVLERFTPDRIIIEPSGVGKLSDVMKAVLDVAEDAEVELATYTAVADAMKLFNSVPLSAVRPLSYLLALSSMLTSTALLTWKLLIKPPRSSVLHLPLEMGLFDAQP